MLYRPVWIFCMFLYRIFFRNFHVNRNKISDNTKPVIIVANHVNAFIDPIIYPSLLLKRIYFIVRGDVFDTPLKHWILWNLGQIPMFRRRDGLDQVKKNEKSFEKCYELLGKRQSIMIFPEGDCVQEKRLRPIQKGTARMAFGAIEKHGWDIDLQILPITMNYTHPKEFRTEVMCNIGAPIPLSNYRKTYEENPNKAYVSLSKDIEQKMKDIYIHLDHKETDDLFEDLVALKRSTINTRRIPWLKNGAERFNMEQKLAQQINDLKAKNSTEIETLEQLNQRYQELKGQLKLSEKVLGKNAPNVVLAFLTAVLLFPVFAIGYLLNIVQFRFANNIVDKKIKLVIFKNSIRLGILLITNLLLILISSLILLFFNWKYALAFPFLFWSISFITINYKEYVSGLTGIFHRNKMRAKFAEQYQEIIQLRTRILQKID